MLDFGGTAQKLWVLHCLDSFRPFLSVAKLRMLSSFAVSRLAYLGFQSKEIVIVCYLTQVGTGLYPDYCACHVLVIWYCATVCRFYKGVIWSLNSQANHYIG